MPGGLGSLEHRFCPFHGKYKFSYTSRNKNVRCDSPNNVINNCPHADRLNIQLRGCSTFNKIDMNFICLGDWENPQSMNGERYLALMDLRTSPDIVKYRCGVSNIFNVYEYFFFFFVKIHLPNVMKYLLFLPDAKRL